MTTGSADSADVLVVGFDDGTVHLSIYDFFEIGTFELERSSSSLHGCKALLHCFHPSSTTHSLLVSHASGSERALCLVHLDLRLLSSTGRNVSILASKSTQLQNLLRYIRQVQVQMYGDFKASQDLPSRFIGNIEEILKEKGSWTWVQAAYHLVVTGDCPPGIKEWLVDQLGERVR